MKIGVTGFKGRLGSYLVEFCGCFPLDCDITDRKSIKKSLANLDPEAIINCASWTDVDGAEKAEVQEAVLAVNLRGPALLRQEFDGLLVQMSTGFVFDGTSGPNKETDDRKPVNGYGWSKLGGEESAMMRPGTLIVRVLDLYGPISIPGKPDFVRQMRDVLELGAAKNLPYSLQGTPTYIPHVSEALLEVVRQKMTGIIHLAGDLTLSRFDWGRKIAAAFGYDPDLIQPTSEIKGAAPRPLNGGLNVDKAKGLGLPIYSPDEGLAALIRWEQTPRGESIA